MDVRNNLAKPASTSTSRPFGLEPVLRTHRAIASMRAIAGTEHGDRGLCFLPALSPATRLLVLPQIVSSASGEASENPSAERVSPIESSVSSSRRSVQPGWRRPIATQGTSRMPPLPALFAA